MQPAAGVQQFSRAAFRGCGSNKFSQASASMQFSVLRPTVQRVDAEQPDFVVLLCPAAQPSRPFSQQRHRLRAATVLDRHFYYAEASHRVPGRTGCPCPLLHFHDFSGLMFLLSVLSHGTILSAGATTVEETTPLTELTVCLRGNQVWQSLLPVLQQLVHPRAVFFHRRAGHLRAAPHSDPRHTNGVQELQE